MHAQLAEWGVRHICSFVGSLAGEWLDTSKTGGRNPLVDAAQEINVFAGEDPRERELNEMRGEKVADDWRDDPRLQRTVAADPSQGVEAENPSGSFEAFMAMMGGGMRPAMPDVNGAGSGQN